MTIKFRRDVYELIVESIQKDTDTFLDDSEKDIVLSILHHFFDVNGWDTFTNTEIGLNEYNKYYKENYRKYHNRLEENYLISLMEEDENESKWFKQRC